MTAMIAAMAGIKRVASLAWRQEGILPAGFRRGEFLSKSQFRLRMPGVIGGYADLGHTICVSLVRLFVTPPWLCCSKQS